MCHSPPSNPATAAALRTLAGQSRPDCRYSAMTSRVSRVSPSDHSAKSAMSTSTLASMYSVRTRWTMTVICSGIGLHLGLVEDRGAVGLLVVLGVRRLDQPVDRVHLDGGLAVAD